MRTDKTAEGLRDRLFDALDRVINKEISQKEVESVCFVSEQIIKTARVELETLQEAHKEKENVRQHQLRMVREQQESVALLENVMDNVLDIEEGEDEL